MKRFLASMIMLLYCLVFPGSGATAEEIRVGYFVSPPLSFLGFENSPQGISIDLIHEIAIDQGWNISLIPGSRSECLRRLENGEIDVVAAYPFSYDLSDSVDFTNNSIVADWGAVYASKLIVANIQDLAGRRIGVAHNDPQAKAFRSLAGNLGVGFTMIQFDSYRDVFEAIQNGSVDAGIANRLYGMRYAESMEVQATPVLFNPVSMRFGVSKTSEIGILEALDAKLGELKADGESAYYVSLKKWLSPESAGRSMLDSPLLWGGIVLLALVLFFGGFWLMQQLSASSSEASRHEEALKKETKVRKRAQVALWESVERHRAMFTDNMLPQLLVNNDTYEIVEINPAAEAFYRFPEGELVGMGIHDINAEPLQKVNAYLQEIGQGRSRLTTKHRMADGRVCDVELFISTLFIHEQSHNFITVVDISERVSAEKARMDSEERLDLAVKGGDLGFWDWDVMTGSMIFNERYAEMLGFDLGELGDTFDDWVVRLHPDDYDRLQDDLRLSLEDEDASHNTQFRMRTRSGEWRWFVSRGRVSQRTDTGKPLRMTGIAYDITSRKQTEDRLASINTCVLGFGPKADENISSLTDLAGELLGGSAAFYSRARHAKLSAVSAWNVPEGQLNMDISSGHLSHDLISKDVDGLHVVRGLLTSRFAQSDPDVVPVGAKTYIGQIVRVDGRPVGVLCVMFRDDFIPTESDEKLFGIIAAAIRVEEERKLSGEQLIEAKDAAESASRSKSEFLANMSHEIRTPLNGIFGMLQLVGETDLNNEQKDFVTTALTSGRSLLRVINDVLDFSKMEAGMLALEKEPFDFRNMVSSVLDNFTVQAAEKGLAMSVEIDDDLPLTLMGDEARIRQILFNLVGNAVKFTPEGKVGVESWVVPPGNPSQNMRLFVTVSDTGIGIPDHMIESVFSAFSQADGSYTRRYGGTGLGLGIVKRLVNLMGGEIAVESDDNGTKIHFFVRVQEGLGIPSVDEPAIPPSVNIEPMAVLLVEDERVNRLSVQRHLEKMGHTVTTAEDGYQVLDLLNWNDFDLILMDIQMPNMDGITATRAIRGNTSLGSKADTPIVALTAHAMKGDREKFLAAGMNDYLAKPVEFVDLVSILSRMSSVVRERKNRA